MYSKYIDNSTRQDEQIVFLTLAEILQNILNYSEWRTPELDPYTAEALNYEVLKVFEENQTINIKETEITYNVIKYSYDIVISGQEVNPMHAERLKTTSGTVVVYSDGVRTQYLVDRARGNAALRILRIINNSEKNKIIEAQSFNIDEDFFIWLISRFMEDNRVIDEENSISISRIIGFRGEGNQKQAILSGSGNEVMNLLSSLSFLIEMDVMTEIEIRIQQGNETFEIRFYSNKSQIDILVDNYVGDDMMLVKEEKDPKILLKTFIDLIPSIMNSYNEDVSSLDWNENSKRDFTLGLVDSVRHKLGLLYPLEQA